MRRMQECSLCWNGHALGDGARGQAGTQERFRVRNRSDNQIGKLESANRVLTIVLHLILILPGIYITCLYEFLYLIFSNVKIVTCEVRYLGNRGNG